MDRSAPDRWVRTDPPLSYRGPQPDVKVRNPPRPRIAHERALPSILRSLWPSRSGPPDAPRGKPLLQAAVRRDPESRPHASHAASQIHGKKRRSAPPASISRASFLPVLQRCNLRFPGRPAARGPMPHHPPERGADTRALRDASLLPSPPANNLARPRGALSEQHARYTTKTLRLRAPNRVQILCAAARRKAWRAPKICRVPENRSRTYNSSAAIAARRQARRK